MSKKNILNFEELVGKLRKPEGKSAAIQPGSKKGVVEYWEKKENGFVYDKLINLFEDEFDGTLLSLLNTLNYLNLYMAENNDDILENNETLKHNDESFAYADLYMWFASTFLEEEENRQVLLYNFNGDLPPALSFGAHVLNELTILKNEMDYDAGQWDPEYKKSGDKLLKYIGEKSSDMCIVACFDDKNEKFIADQVGFFKDMPVDISEYMIKTLKSNIIQLHRDKGEILVLYKVGEKLILNGFYTGENGFEVMDTDGIEDMMQYCKDQTETSGQYDDLVSAFGVTTLEVADL